MKQSFFLPVLLIPTVLFALLSCEQPRTRSYDYETQPSGSAGFSNRTDESTGGQDADKEDTPTSTPTTSEYSCGTETYNRSGSYLGSYYLCQSSKTNNQFLFKLQQTVNVQICLFPMYTTSGSSMYIGEAQCQYVPTNSTGKAFVLHKNRSGFENYTLNSVMIMKDEASNYPYPFNGTWANTSAFLQCMHTAHLTQDYCNAYTSKRQYEMVNL